MSLTAYRDASAFDALAAEWNPLVERSVGNSPFLRLEYQRAWWQHLGEGELLVVAVRSEGGRLIGIGNLFGGRPGAEGVVYRIIGCMEIADYLDLIVERGREAEVCAAIMGFLTGPEAPAWDKLDLCNLPSWSSTPEIMAQAATARGFPAALSTLEPCPVIALPATWDEYLDSLDGKQRREMRRKLRRAEAGEEKIEWFIVGKERDIAAEAEAFLDLMARSSPDKTDFLTPAMRSLFREVIAGAQANGWLQLAFLQVNGQRAAAYLNFDYLDRIWVYNSGLAPELFAYLSPGWVLLSYLIQWAIEHGRKEFDFLRGGEAYKYQFGGKDTQIQRLVITNPTPLPPATARSAPHPAESQG